MSIICGYKSCLLCLYEDNNRRLFIFCLGQRIGSCKDSFYKITVILFMIYLDLTGLSLMDCG